MMYKIIVETAVYVEADSREQAENYSHAVVYGETMMRIIEEG